MLNFQESFDDRLNYNLDYDKRQIHPYLFKLLLMEINKTAAKNLSTSHKARKIENLNNFSFRFRLAFVIISTYWMKGGKASPSFIFALTLAPIIISPKKNVSPEFHPRYLLPIMKTEKEGNYRLPFILISSIFSVYFPFAILINALSKASPRKINFINLQLLSFSYISLQESNGKFKLLFIVRQLF